MMRINGCLSWNRLSRVMVIGLLLTSVGCGLTNGYVLNQSGIRQYRRGHYAQARNRFVRALRHDPCNPDYRHNLAMSLQKQGDIRTSEQILRHNLTIDAAHQPTYHSLAQLMVAQGRAPEAQEMLTTWAATQPYAPESNIEMAWIQRETGDVAGAEQSLFTALKADPSNPIALANLGQLYQGAGREDQAVAYYQRSLSANWNQPEVQSRLATIIEPGRISRSSLMQNPASAPMMADGPILADSMMAAAPMMPDSPMMAASYPMVTESQGISMDVSDPHRHHRRRQADVATASSAYSMPTYQAAPDTWTRVGTPIMAGNSTMLSQVDLPPLVPPQTYTSLNSMIVTSGVRPTPIAQADPAHASDTNIDLAALPVVDPH